MAQEKLALLSKFDYPIGKCTHKWTIYIDYKAEKDIFGKLKPGKWVWSVVAFPYKSSWWIADRSRAVWGQGEAKTEEDARRDSQMLVLEKLQDCKGRYTYFCNIKVEKSGGGWAWGVEAFPHAFTGLNAQQNRKRFGAGFESTEKKAIAAAEKCREQELERYRIDWSDTA